jgi:hypothetical protein
MPGLLAGHFLFVRCKMSAWLTYAVVAWEIAAFWVETDEIARHRHLFL